MSDKMPLDHEVTTLAVYGEQVNIPLFNTVVHHALNTAPAVDPGFRRRLCEHIWFDPDMHAPPKFRYLGEVLERHEEMYGDGIAEFRAIAVALGVVQPIVTGDMFVGAQRANFIRKLRRLSKGDVYLKGALLLCEPDKRIEGLRVFGEAKFADAGELVFAMCLFDDFGMAYQSLKRQVLSFFGADRTLEVAGNESVFTWLITNLATVTKGERGKDAALPRALSALYTSHAKENSKPRQVLMEHGYSIEDIAYLNQIVLYEDTGIEHIFPKTIVGERIAVDMAVTLLNSGNTHLDSVYRQLDKLLRFHHHFEIKLQGRLGLLEAIADTIQLTNADTFLWLYGYVNENARYGQPLPAFSFDPRDARWDKLARRLSVEAYTRLFDAQLLRMQGCDDTAACYAACIARYETLTGQVYQRSFAEYTYSRVDVFSALVKSGTFSLRVLFEEAVEFETQKDCGFFDFIGSFIKGVESREAFDFLRFFFSQHDAMDVENFFNAGNVFNDSLYRNPSPYSYYGRREQGIHVCRDFLSDEEVVLLLSWLDEHMFYHRPMHYMDFLCALIADEKLHPLVPFDQRQASYRQLAGSDYAIPERIHESLRKLYMTADEYAAHQATMEANEAEAQRRKQEADMQKVDDVFAEKAPDTFGALYAFIRKYEGYSSFALEHAHALRLVNDAMRKLCTEERVSAMPWKDLCDGVILAACLLKYEKIDLQDYFDRSTMLLEVLRNAESPEHSTEDGDHGDDS